MESDLRRDITSWVVWIRGSTRNGIGAGLFMTGSRAETFFLSAECAGNFEIWKGDFRRLQLFRHLRFGDVLILSKRWRCRWFSRS